MKKLLMVLLIFFLMVNCAFASNITVDNVTFDIPQQYEGGRQSPSAYVFESGFKFRILSLDNYNNLKMNYGDEYDSDVYLSSQTSNIAGHDAVVIRGHYNDKDYTSIYFVTGDTIFLICFNDTVVNDDIKSLISGTPAQNISSENFHDQLNQALSDRQEDVLEDEIYYHSQQAYNRGYDDGSNSRFFFRYF